MANGIRSYQIGSRRLSRGWIEGFDLNPAGLLTVHPDCPSHTILLAALDSAQEDCPWGRFCFHADLQGEAVLTIRAFASNNHMFVNHGVPVDMDDFLLDRDVVPARKDALFQAANGLCISGTQDVLLYSLKGRYLWIWVELTGVATGYLENFRVLVPGDHFYRTFPSLYQTDGEFFHRYLSIFSSLYMDLQDKIDGIHQYLDLDTAPAEILPIFSSWLGLALDGNFLEESQLRQLLKIAPDLIRAKGTRRAIELVASLFVEEPVQIVERNLLDPSQLAGCSLYGDQIYDFTVLVSGRSHELLRSRLEFLINQFKPLRSRCKIIFLGDQSGVDAFAYLDMNAALLQPTSGNLDDGTSNLGMVYLDSSPDDEAEEEVSPLQSSFYLDALAFLNDD